MSSDQAIELLTRLLFAAMAIPGPLIAATLAVGVAVRVLPVETKLQEATLTYVPKLIAAGAILLLAGPWMLSGLTQFARQSFQLIPSLG